MLPGDLLPSDTCSPTAVALQIVEGVGASLIEGEGVYEGEDVGVGEDETESAFGFDWGLVWISGANVAGEQLAREHL
jgi:hypothetical protein